MVFPQHELAEEAALHGVGRDTRDRFLGETGLEKPVKYFAVSGDGGVK
jgi:hypothetical protein